MNSQRWYCCGLLALALGLGAPRESLAQDPAPAPAQRADAEAAKWLSQGNKAFKDGKFDEAEQAYQKAFAVKKVYDIAGNLAMAEFAQGKSRAAAEHLAFALRSFPITGDPATKDQMQKTYEQSRGAVSALKVSVLPKGAMVYVDGKAAGEAPLLDDVFVEPGKHSIKATLQGYGEMSKSVEAQKGQSVPVALELKALPKEVVTIKEHVAPPVKRSLVPTFVAGGVAVASFIVGGALLGVSSGKASEVSDQATAIGNARKSCLSTSPVYDQGACTTLEDTAHAADTMHNAGVAMLVVGGVAAAGAVTWLLLPAPKPKPTAALTLRPIPVLGPGQAGLLVAGSF
ncbi:MAG: PEGA domain-containing protein [Minicystis sp.]